MKLKVGDRVQVMAGKDKGKQGKVLQVLPSELMVVVEGANQVVKHVRSRQRGTKGQRLQLNGPLRQAKVQLICPSCGKLTRVGFQRSESGQKFRRCQKCQATLS